MTGALVGEFLDADAVVGAARRLAANGFYEFDTLSPAPIAELDELLPKRKGVMLAAIMAAAGIGAFVGALLLQDYAAAVAFPVNVGGRPLDSWPAFIPSAWEICAFATVYAGFLAFLLVCRLPRLYQPIFSVPGIERASQDRFFLTVNARDTHFDIERVRFIFERYGAVRVSEVAE